jgi:hypothetical protein
VHIVRNYYWNASLFRQSFITRVDSYSTRKLPERLYLKEVVIPEAGYVSLDGFSGCKEVRFFVMFHGAFSAKERTRKI